MTTISWQNAVNANWTDAAGWSTGTVPGASDDAVIGAVGSYTITLNSSITVDIVAIGDKSATLSISNAGGTESLAGDLINNGLIAIDTANAAGGSTVTIGGTLGNAGTVEIGNGNLSAPSTVIAAALANAATLVLQGGSANEAVVDITGTRPTSLGQVQLHGKSLLEVAASVATIGAGSLLLLDGTGAHVAIAGSLTTNSGLIGLSNLAGTLELQNGAALVLTGGLDVSGVVWLDGPYNNSRMTGSTLSVAGDLTNSGTVALAWGVARGSGADGLTITGTLNNSGLFDLADDNAAPSTVTAAALVDTGTINISGDQDGDGTGEAVLNITTGAAPGTLGAPITLFGPSLLEFASGGIATIASSGEVAENGANAFVADAGTTTSNSALTGITAVAGTLELQNGAALVLTGGLDVSGVVWLDGPYNNSRMTGSTLSVAGDLTNSGTVALAWDVARGSGADGLTITGTLNNSGLFDLADDNAAPSTVTAAALVDTGTINISGDQDGDGTGEAVLNITTGAAPGTLGAPITLFGPSLLEFASGGIATIASSGEVAENGANAFVADAGTTTSNSALTGITAVVGTLELQNGAALVLTGGLDVSGAVWLDGPYNNSRMTGSTLSVAGDLTNSGTVALAWDVARGSGADGLTITGTLNNSGLFDLADDNAAPSTVTAAALVDTGTINISGDQDGDGTGEAVLNITTGAAPGTLGAPITLFGPSLLEFASGGIATIASNGEVAENGANAFVADAGTTTSNSALTGITAVVGTLELQNGAALALTGGLNVSGAVWLDGPYNNSRMTGSTLSVAGDLTNSGTVALAWDVARGSGADGLTITGTLNNSGLFDLADDNAAPSTVTAAALVDTGTINISGDQDGDGTGEAVLNITTGAAPGTLGAPITLFGPSLLEFASGGIATIASNGEVAENGANAFVADAGTTTSNSALTGITAVAGTLELANNAALSLTGGLKVTGAVYLDGPYNNTQMTGATLSVAGDLTNSGTVSLGGSARGSGADVLTIKGTLSNSGLVDLGNDNAASMTVTAAALMDTGTINLAGDQYGDGTGEAVLDVTGAATIDGLLTLGGDAVVSAGTLVVASSGRMSGFGTIEAPANNGTISAGGGVLEIVGSITGTGDLAIGAGATLELSDADAEPVTFDASTSTLRLDTPSRFSGAIDGLVAGDTIELPGIAVADAQVVGPNLIVATGVAQVFSFAVSGRLTGNSFTSTSDGHGGSDLVFGGQTSAPQPYDGFYLASTVLATDISDNAPATQIANDALNVYVAAIAGAIGTVGTSAWQQAYSTSNIAAGTVSADITDGNSSTQTLQDVLGLYSTIIAGAAGVIAGGVSQSDYITILQAAGTLSTDIAAKAGGSQLSGDLANLFNTLIAATPHAANAGAWLQAETTSGQALATLSTDIGSSASGARILADASTLYDTILSGALGAIGGASLQQAYQAGAQNLITLGLGVANGADDAQLQQNVGGIYNIIISDVAGASASAIMNDAFNVAARAAGAVIGDIVANNSNGALLADVQGSFNDSLLSQSGTAGVGSQAALINIGNVVAQLNGGIAKGVPLANLGTIAAPLIADFLGGPSDPRQKQFDTNVMQAASTLSGPLAQGGTAAAQAAAGFYGSVMEDFLAAAVGTNVTTVDIQSAQTLVSDLTAGNGAAVPGDLGSLFATLSPAVSVPNIASEGGEGPSPAELVQEWGDVVQEAIGELIPNPAEIINASAETALTGEELLTPAEIANAEAIAAVAGPVGVIVGVVGALQLGNTIGGALAKEFERLPPNNPARKAGNAINNSIYHSITGVTGLLLTPIPYPPGSGPNGGGWGDVHLTTFDGLHYDFQAAGEFVLSKSTAAGDSFQVQIRLQPYGTSTSVSVTTQLAAEVGSDRVTFVPDRTQPVWVDGTASTLSAGSPTLSLSGGTITELSPDSYQVLWNTGEEITVTIGGSYLNYTVSLGPNDGPGSLQGLLGPNEGQANDFQLPDGTVLPQQSLTSDQLYDVFGNAWRITQATSLFDYGAGQSTDTFTNPDFPGSLISLFDLPANLVSEAKALLGTALDPPATPTPTIDPGLAADGELDYLATGNPSFITDAISLSQLGVSTTPVTITPSSPPAPTLGVAASAPSIIAAASGTTGVVFDVYLTAAVTNDTTAELAVTSPGPGFLGTTAFGGTLPSGTVTIAAGQTLAAFTIDVPQGALGTNPGEALQVQISGPTSDPVFAPTAQTTIVNATPEPGPAPVPRFVLLTNFGTLMQSGGTYTLALGMLPQGAPLPQLQFALDNEATAPADNMTGTFATPSGIGFNVTGATTPPQIVPGGSYNGLSVGIDTGIYGSNSETISFTPQDVNPSGFTATLPALTLLVTDTIESPAELTLNSPSTITFTPTRIGTSESEAVSITNSATSPAADLTVTPVASGAATASGTITALAPGATDTVGLSVGLNTGTAGLQTGVVALGTGSVIVGAAVASLASSNAIDVSGPVYREAAASIQPLNATIEVGASGTIDLPIMNGDPADGFSENLLASVSGASGSVTASGTTGLIAAGSSDTSSILVSVPSGQVGVYSGSIILDLTSDGGTGVGAIDGLGTVALAPQVVPVSVTVVVPCFAAGTRIATDRGEVPVQNLAAGNRVLTASGALQPVRWIGRRRLDCRRHASPEKVLPVRVQAHAFGQGLPARDLHLSPDHAVYIYGKLIPIRALINWSTIVQEPARQVTYYHVELPRHDIILAEQLPTESYLDLGNRAAFENDSGAVMLHPDFAAGIWERNACAEMILGGPLLAAVRRRLLLQAIWLGYRISDDPDLRLEVGQHVINPNRVGQRYRFVLPAGARTARLVSRPHVPSVVPSDRLLGVPVAKLLMDRRPLDLSDQRLGKGWFDPQRGDGRRWTDGDARITITGMRELIVRLVGPGQYWSPPSRSAERVA